MSSTVVVTFGIAVATVVEPSIAVSAKSVVKIVETIFLMSDLPKFLTLCKKTYSE